MSKAAEILESYKVMIIAGYHAMPDPKPLDEVCALLIEGSDRAALLICRVDDIEDCLTSVSNVAWPEFVEYAKRRMVVQPAVGMLRVVMATSIGMAAGRVQVLPGAQA